jgi:hypothetical protein
LLAVIQADEFCVMKAVATDGWENTSQTDTAIQD